MSLYQILASRIQFFIKTASASELFFLHNKIAAEKRGVVSKSNSAIHDSDGSGAEAVLKDYCEAQCEV